MEDGKKGVSLRDLVVNVISVILSIEDEDNLVFNINFIFCKGWLF